MSNPVALVDDNLVDGMFKLRFTYSAAWTPTTAPFDARFERYLDSEFFEHKVGSPFTFTTIQPDLDSLGVHLELFHDGALSHWHGGCDFAANSASRFGSV